MYFESTIRSAQDPHLYWTCSEAYKTALASQRDHMLVLSGESGSGKTETFKYALDFFAKMTCKKESMKNRLLMVKARFIFLIQC
jgi:myosin heavy subunit